MYIDTIVQNSELFIANVSRIISWTVQVVMSSERVSVPHYLGNTYQTSSHGTFVCKRTYSPAWFKGVPYTLSPIPECVQTSRAWLAVWVTAPYNSIIQIHTQSLRRLGNKQTARNRCFMGYASSEAMPSGFLRISFSFDCKRAKAQSILHDCLSIFTSLPPFFGQYIHTVLKNLLCFPWVLLLFFFFFAILSYYCHKGPFVIQSFLNFLKRNQNSRRESD